MRDRDQIILESLYSDLLTEQIYGNRGFVYHRTPYDPSNSDLIKMGISSGRNIRALYGKGLYCCYDFKSQMRESMRQTYGKYIIKGMIDLNGFAILDADIYTKSNPSGNFRKHLEEIGTNYENWKEVMPYSSEIAVEIWEDLKRKGYNGIVFNGASDGRVAVVWNRKNFIPFKYTRDDGESWIDLKPNISNIKRDFDLEYDFDEEKDNPIIEVLHNVKKKLKNFKLEYDLTNIEENEIYVRAMSYFIYDFSKTNKSSDELKEISGKVIDSIGIYLGSDWYDMESSDVIQSDRVLFDVNIEINEKSKDDVAFRLTSFLNSLEDFDQKWETKNKEFKLAMDSLIQ